MIFPPPKFLTKTVAKDIFKRRAFLLDAIPAFNDRSAVHAGKFRSNFPGLSLS